LIPVSIVVRKQRDPLLDEKIVIIDSAQEPSDSQSLDMVKGPICSDGCIWSVSERYVLRICNKFFTFILANRYRSDHNRPTTSSRPFRRAPLKQLYEWYHSLPLPYACMSLHVH